MSRRRIEPRRIEQLTVRFPQGMLAILRMSAQQNDRSLNAEIVHILRRWIDGQQRALTSSPSP